MSDFRGSQQNLRTYTISLTAGQEFDFNVDGDVYRVIEASAEFTITFDESNRFTKSAAGTGAKFNAPYSRVVLLSTTTQTVTIVFGFGNFYDERATVNATINTTIQPSDTLDDPEDVTVSNTAIQLVAANANRKEVMCHVPSDAANSIRIGTASVTATAGLEVEPGTTITLATETAVYAIRDGSSDVNVSILDLTRP